MAIVKAVFLALGLGAMAACSAGDPEPVVVIQTVIVVATATPTPTGADVLPQATVALPTATETVTEVPTQTAAPTATAVPPTVAPRVIIQVATPTAVPPTPAPEPTATPGPRLTAWQARDIAGALIMPKGKTFAACWGMWPLGVQSKYSGGLWTVSAGVLPSNISAFVDDATLEATVGATGRC